MSPLFRLDSRDALKGLIVAVIASFLTSIYSILEAGTIPTAPQWRVIGLTALATGIAYLIKNVLTNSEGKLIRKEHEPDC